VVDTDGEKKRKRVTMVRLGWYRSSGSRRGKKHQKKNQKRRSNKTSLRIRHGHKKHIKVTRTKKTQKIQ